jgi:hypothetical protein
VRIHHLQDQTDDSIRTLVDGTESHHARSTCLTTAGNEPSVALERNCCAIIGRTPQAFSKSWQISKCIISGWQSQADQRDATSEAGKR